MLRNLYKDSGVDVKEGEAFVKDIQPLTEQTARPGSSAKIGGFGGIFDLKAAGYKDPLLVSSTDGVGSKLKVATALNKYDTIGIDLVAMCVNDIIVHGAEPLYFLDYYATHHISHEIGKKIISGIVKGCQLAGCALIGGETAELPSIYSNENFDLAGFAVGAVERGKELTGETIKSGDILLGLESSGLHSNGFSLVHSLIKKHNLQYYEELLTPTRIYVSSCLEVHNTGEVKGFAHITGGGFVNNILRVIPHDLTIQLIPWELPSIFKWLLNLGVTPSELLDVFNCGVGMVVIVKPANVEIISDMLTFYGETVKKIGYVT